jgi:CRP/FNR family transcriptional regulator, cyclic AMP receptor protein
MTTETRAEADAMAARLEHQPLLAGLNHAQIALLADCALTSHFKGGQVIFREGEPADRFYLIEKGKLCSNLAPVMASPSS